MGARLAERGSRGLSGSGELLPGSAFKRHCIGSVTARACRKSDMADLRELAETILHGLGLDSVLAQCYSAVAFYPLCGRCKCTAQVSLDSCEMGGNIAVSATYQKSASRSDDRMRDR